MGRTNFKDIPTGEQRMDRALLMAGVLLAVTCGSPLPRCAAQEPAGGEQTERGDLRELLGEGVSAMKTFGGRQFWGDVQFFHDWRIQKNTFTGHYRLLDGNDRRHASGTLEKCRATLEEIKRERDVPPMSGKGVILIHGIGRSSKSFTAMTARLEEAGYHVFRFEYPSTRVGIPVAAEQLHQVISNLDGIDQIDIVVHSMGGLVVRSYLAAHQDPRLHRLVMLGVPNLGACMADRLRRNVIFRAVYGPAGQQLCSDEDGFIAGLPVPEFEFAVISGGRGNGDGWNPLIPGDDDGTVSVDCTRLPGASDSMRVPHLHTFLMAREDVIEATLRFLETGRLRADGAPEPIPVISVEPAEAAGAP